MVAKPGKLQTSEEKGQDLCWKGLDHAQSFVLRSYTMLELHNGRQFLLVNSLVRGKQLMCSVHG